VLSSFRLCPKLCPSRPITGPNPAPTSQRVKPEPLGKPSTYRGALVRVSRYTRSPREHDVHADHGAP
jgi:hypothetical protein